MIELLYIVFYIFIVGIVGSMWIDILSRIPFLCEILVNGPGVYIEVIIILLLFYVICSLLGSSVACQSVVFSIFVCLANGVIMINTNILDNQHYKIVFIICCIISIFVVSILCDVVVAFKGVLIPSLVNPIVSAIVSVVLYGAGAFLSFKLTINGLGDYPEVPNVSSIIAQQDTIIKWGVVITVCIYTFYSIIKCIKAFKKGQN